MNNVTENCPFCGGRNTRAAAGLAALRAQNDALKEALSAVVEMVDYAVEAHAYVSDTCITMQKARAALSLGEEVTK